MRSARQFAHDARELGELIGRGDPCSRKSISSCTYVASRPDSSAAATALECGPREARAVRAPHERHGPHSTVLVGGGDSRHTSHTRFASPGGQRLSCRGSGSREPTSGGSRSSKKLTTRIWHREGWLSTEWIQRRQSRQQKCQDSDESERISVKSAELASLQMAQTATNRNVENRRWRGGTQGSQLQFSFKSPFRVLRDSSFLERRRPLLRLV